MLGEHISNKTTWIVRQWDFTRQQLCLLMEKRSQWLPWFLSFIVRFVCATSFLGLDLCFRDHKMRKRWGSDDFEGARPWPLAEQFCSRLAWPSLENSAWYFYTFEYALLKNNVPCQVVNSEPCEQRTSHWKVIHNLGLDEKCHHFTSHFPFSDTHMTWYELYQVEYKLPKKCLK